MTNREFYSAIVEGNITADVVEFAKSSIAKLDAKNEARRNAVTPKRAKDIEYKAAILEAIPVGKEVFAAEVAPIIDVTLAKATSLLSRMPEFKVVGKAKYGEGKTKVNVYERVEVSEGQGESLDTEDTED